MSPKGWKSSRLSDLIEVKHGWPFKSEFFNEIMTGKPIIVSIGNFRYTGGFRFDTTTIKEYRDSYPKAFELTPGDILLVMTCQTPDGEILGIPARTPDDGRLYLHNQRLGKVVIKRHDLVDDKFLYYLFLCKDFNQELMASSTGTKIVHTAPTRIEAFTFDRPPLDEQRQIGSLLSALDEKIELNRKTNRTLEELTQGLFQSWFVDFDPVVAKREGRRPVGVPEMVQSLFPDQFEESELGPIPFQWSTRPIGALLTICRESVDPQSRMSEIFEHYSIPAFDLGYRPTVEAGSAIQSIKFLVQEDCILLSKLNPNTPRVWWPKNGGGRCRIASTEFMVLKPVGDISLEYLHALICSEPFTDEFAGLATGTSNSHQRVKPPDFLRIKMTMPPPKLIDAFANITNPWMQAFRCNAAETATLSALRDCLIDPLLLGELSLTEAERAVTAVL